MSQTKTILIVEERIVERHTCFETDSNNQILNITTNGFFDYFWY
jgi:hypothetical protein